jgi:copper/silver efflux system protein
MIRKIIEVSARHRFIVLLIYAIIIGVGVWATVRTPLDAIPDVSDNQVIVYVDWPGRSPQLVEDQVTYPLASNLQGLPNLKAVRAQSMFGFSLVYVIFRDDVDIYWARTRVLERLNYISALLPAGVTPRLGPEGTGVGHVFWYTLQSKSHDLGQLRSIQDWYLKLGLQSVDGVAEVASVGGFVKQYQVNLDPIKMAARGVSLDTVVNAVRRSNNDVGGRLIHIGETESIVRGIGYIQQVSDLENIVVDAPGGTPIYLSSLGTVTLSSDIRRGLLEENGQGEVVGGIIVARYGENAKAVIDRVKERLEELKKGLPPGVTIRTAYDRSELIERAVQTLTHALMQEGLIVSLVVVVFLLHAGSAVTVLVGLPLSALFSFIMMYSFGITSNIMSLGGVALAIGEIVDASIVMVENAYRHLAEGTEEMRKNRVETIIRASQQVGPAIFGSLLVMIASFLPVFLLTGREGKLFHPLAYTKTFAMIGASLLAITLVPVLMTFFLKGRMRPESQNPVSRFFTRAYEPFLRWSLRNGKTMLVLNVIALVITVPLMMSLGTEFMPPLDEGSLLYMPVTLPAINITEARRIIQVQDRIIASHPAVAYVLGKVGRAETATDPAPVSMFETIIELKPKSEWPAGMTKDQIIQELNEHLQIPGVTNAWTQPIINRIDMLNTGVRTTLGVKIFGPDLDTLEKLALHAETVLRKVPGAVDLYTERISGGQYLDIQVDREAIARYGIPVGVVLDSIETAIGGMNVTTTVEGRARYPVQVRYLPDYRDDVASLQNLLITIPRGGGMAAEPAPGPAAGGMMGGAAAPSSGGGMASAPPAGGTIQLPLGQLARISSSAGPAMINSENGQLRSLVQLNVRGRDMGSFVNEARRALAAEMTIPEGYSMAFSGQYEDQIHARKRLQVLVPLVLIIIFVILYFTFNSAVEASLVMLSVPFALIGGVYLMWLYGFNWSVAVWVGFIALYGVAVQTGVVMVLYLHEALDRHMLAGPGPVTEKTIFDATVEGALLRVRPKIMTVATTVIGLMPLLWATGTGSDVMKPIAVPLIGGMVTSTIHVLLVTPIIFVILKQRDLRRGRLVPSGLRAEPGDILDQQAAAQTQPVV